MENKDIRRFTSKSEAHKAFNTLTGIIDGISIDNKIEKKEIKELEKWSDKYEFLTKTNPFNEVLTNVQVLISDNDNSEEIIENIKWLVNKFSGGFNYYNDLTSDLQKFQGILHGILADGKITEDEVIGLQSWLNENEHLATYYPYDEIYSLITDILSDKKVDDNEKEFLIKYLNEFVIHSNSKDNTASKELTLGGICAITPEISFKEKQFCFTGVSMKYPRNKIISIIKDLEGKYINKISSKTDYLIIGSNGNPCWAYACYGRKVEEAIQLRKKGSNITLVHENDFWDEVLDII